MPPSSTTSGHQRSRGGRSASSTAATIPTSLAKTCLQLHHPDQRFTNDAIELSSEFLKFFVVEARRRAAIELNGGYSCTGQSIIQAECEAEAEIEDNGDRRRKKKIDIRADHIAKIAAELLLDLS
ncbi:hypothetical protein ACHAW5_004322 [Stephanodiscus triporus]|uniref:Centromere protein X n=1 Tax=Stephanodiscus triporus TaxID=2934178 RepID=A0ABD3MY51_9STRA